MAPGPEAEARAAGSAGTDAEATASEPADAALPALAGLDRIKAREFPLSVARGVLQQSALTLHGIPLRRAFETTIVDPKGARRVVAAARPSAAPQLMPADAAIPVDKARTIAAAHGLDPRAGDKPADDARLVYLMILETPVLAWEVDLPLVMVPEPSMKTVWVSAATGVVLDEEEHVRSSKAEVFPQNPAKTPITIVTTLSGVHAEGPGEPLVGERVQAFNCTLEEPADPDSVSPWWDEGECYPIHTALSDANGDYFVPIPDLKYPDQNILGDDLYAELSMYYHAEKFLDHMAAMGVEGFKCDYSSMLSNYRYSKIAVSYPDLDYGPLNNAYYTNQCDPEKGPTMIFGQGSAVDFGYDGDVVYHELGHGMVSHLTPAGLSQRRLRPDASLVDAGGLNEAFADYFSVMLTNDSELGDYVARFWASYGSGSIRSAENTKVCPGNTVGQVHNDGEPMMAALWATRKRVGKDKVDHAFLEMVMRLPNDSDLETAAKTFLQVAEERRTAGEWSDADIEHTTRAFDARGLYDCPRVITDPDVVNSGRTMYLRPNGTGVTPFYPGPMQLRHEVPDGTDNIIVRFRLSPRGSSTGNPNTNPVGALVLIKREDAPIEFEYDLTEVEQSGDPEGKVSVKEIVQVRGDWDIEEAATLVVGSENQLVIRGFRPGEVVYVTLVNTLTNEAVAGSVSVISMPTELLDQGTIPSDGVVTAGEGESESDGPMVTEQSWSGDPTVACACRAPGEGAPVDPLAILALFGIPWGLRRRPRR
ncbi:MAG: M36 family metallopeptidase [Myxococcales bacterium]|nr:M36 family metallopeptidase [Myxococcales bacterium]MCB9705562.1 M36 family metallopeptidase [Myxococcales bacterium]